MNKEEQNIADVTFIANEVIRFARMSIDEIKAELVKAPDSWLAHLSRPGGGILLCGKDAYDRFSELAKRCIKPGSMKAKDFQRQDYVRALRQAFVEIFVEAGQPVQQSTVTKLLNRAEKIAIEELVNVTHHIPCVFLYDQKPHRFQLGPVTFSFRGAFFEEVKVGLSEYHQTWIDRYAESLQNEGKVSEHERLDEARRLANRHIDGIHKYYDEYDWVASVTIPPCHGEISNTRAERAVDAALNVLRLFLRSDSAKFRRADAPNVPLDVRKLVTNSDGKIQATVMRISQAGRAGDDWYDALQNSSPAIPTLWQLFGDAIKPLTTDQMDELNQRLLDALSWLGQAVVERNAGAKVVKYTAALERLSVTGHVDNGLEDLVIKRIIILNQDREDKSLDEIKKKLGELYQCRSDLMHGSLSPHDPSATRVLSTAWEVTRWSLFSAVQLFALLRDNGKANRQALNAAYEGGRRARQISESPQRIDESSGTNSGS